MEHPDTLYTKEIFQLSFYYLHLKALDREGYEKFSESSVHTICTVPFVERSRLVEDLWAPRLLIRNPTLACVNSPSKIKDSAIS